MSVQTHASAADAAAVDETATDASVTPNRVLLQFRAIANAVRTSAWPERPRNLVGDRKLLALCAIARSPDMGVNEVAQCLGLRQPTASQVVGSLLDTGLVDVRRDSLDRRAVLIRVSATGLDVLRHLPPRFDFGDRLPDALRRLDERLLSSLEAGLTGLLQRLHQTEHGGHVATGAAQAPEEAFATRPVEGGPT